MCKNQSRLLLEDIAKTCVERDVYKRQAASSQLGGGAEAEGFNKTLSSLDINVLPKIIFYVVIFMSLVLLVSLIISSFNILRKNPKELLIDNK